MTKAAILMHGGYLLDELRAPVGMLASARQGSGH